MVFVGNSVVDEQVIKRLLTSAMSSTVGLLAHHRSNDAVHFSSRLFSVSSMTSVKHVFLAISAIRWE